MYASKKDIYTSLLSRPSQSIKQTTINISPKAYLHISLILHRSFSAFFYSMEEQTVVLIMSAGPAGLATAPCLTKLCLFMSSLSMRIAVPPCGETAPTTVSSYTLQRSFASYPTCRTQKMPQPTSQRINL